MKYAIVNLGCKVNRVESDAFAAGLESRGWTQASLAEADLLVANTCAVTGEAEKKARKAVRHALRTNTRAPLLVTGCAAALHAQEFEAMDARVRVVGKAFMDEELARISRQLTGATAEESAVPLRRLPVGAGYPTRVGVKVQDGCDNACTYCVVHIARGPATSRPLGEVVAECAALSRAGVAEIVLTGINLGSYHFQGVGLAELAERILQAADENAPTGAHPLRLRVSSIEPMDVDDDFVALLARAGGRVCRHLHLPLQAGSDRVLAEMGRPYTAAEYLALVNRLRDAVPDLSLGTDVIVGFPGETEEDFQATCELARACAFSNIHVFPYSPREGTPAAARTDQVLPPVRARRAQMLRSLARKLRALDWAARAHTFEDAVIEDDGTAMTESHYAVVVEGALPVGSVTRLRLGEAVPVERLGGSSQA